MGTSNSSRRCARRMIDGNCVHDMSSFTSYIGWWSLSSGRKRPDSENGRTPKCRLIHELYPIRE